MPDDRGEQIRYHRSMEHGKSQRQKGDKFFIKKRTKALKRKRIPDIINLQEMNRMICTKGTEKGV